MRWVEGQPSLAHGDCAACPISSASRRTSSHQDAALGFADNPSLASEKARDSFYVNAKSLAISSARSGAGPSRESS